MILPEDLIKIRLQRSIDMINKDRDFIRELFESDCEFTYLGKKETLPELAGLAEKIVEYWEKEPPKVDFCLHWMHIHDPGIYVDYGSESNEGYIGQSLKRFSDKERKAEKFEVQDTMNVPGTVIYLNTSNVTWTRYLYLIVRGIILLDWLWLTKAGLRNLMYSGGNIDRVIPAIPDNIYMRQLTLRYEYNIKIHRFTPYPIGKSLKAEDLDP